MTQSATKLRNVAVIYAGGRYDTFTNQAEYEFWFRRFVEMHLMSRAVPILVCGEVFPKGTRHMIQALRTVWREWENYHGFVITLERTHFVQYATLMHYMLTGRLTKPVIVTTAPPEDQEMERDKYTDMGFRANFINSILSAAVDLAGVLVAVGPELVAPTRAITVGVPSHERSAFGSRERLTAIDNKTYGRIDFGMQRPILTADMNGPRPNLNTHHAESVCWINLTEQKEKQHQQLEQGLRQNPRARAYIIESMHELPLSLTALLPKKAPIITTSPEGVLLFEAGRVLPIEGMLPTTAVGKFLWVLGQKNNQRFTREHGSDLPALMRQNFIDEFIPSGLKTPA